MSLSVIVITRNAGATLRRCLESVQWADEIVVLDSGSSDDTIAIAREFTGKVEVTGEWPGFGPQKNRALDRATGDWVLSLDADEWVTPGLRAEIERTIAGPGAASAYRLPRLSSYCGRPMRHSGWWPDYVVRLFRRGQARFSDDLVHERVVAPGAPATLAAPLMHEAVRSTEQVLEKINAYSSAGAENMWRAGKRGSLGAALFHGSWAFFRTYFLRLGFLDGREGFMLAVTNAESSYYRYVKLMLLSREKRVTGDK
jgi:glycosyltransferase involved in cell wall biosynthesis